MASNAQGALFRNGKKERDNHPDYNGIITLTRELLDAYLIEMGSSKELKVQIAGWRKESQSYGPYISLSVNAPYKKGGSDRPVPRRPSIEDDDPF